MSCNILLETPLSNIKGIGAKLNTWKRKIQKQHISSKDFLTQQDRKCIIKYLKSPRQIKKATII
jgi:hypothetical protein